MYIYSTYIYRYVQLTGPTGVKAEERREERGERTEEREKRGERDEAWKQGAICIFVHILSHFSCL